MYGGNQSKYVFVNLIYLFHIPAFVFICGRFTHKNHSKVAFYCLIYAIFNTFYAHNLLPYKQMWFLFALIIWRFTWKWVSKVPLQIVLPLSIVMACFYGYHFHYLFFFYPFFVLGAMTQNIDITKFKPKASIASVPLFICAYLLLCNVSLNSIRPVAFLLGVVLGFAFLMICPKKKYFFTIAGRYTLWIYLFCDLFLYCITLLTSAAK